MLGEELMTVYPVFTKQKYDDQQTLASNIVKVK